MTTRRKEFVGLSALLCILCLVPPLSAGLGSQARPRTSSPTSSKPEYFAILSAGLGYGINIDEAVQNYPDTRFASGISTFVSLRLGPVGGPKARVCLELSYFGKSMRLREGTNTFGSVRLDWFLMTPGVQWKVSKTAPIIFFALVGVGYGTHRFTRDPSWPGMEVAIEDKLVFMMVPFKVDWPLHKNFSIGASFSGGTGVISKVRWKIFGQTVPDIEEFLFSPVQIQIHVSALF